MSWPGNAKPSWQPSGRKTEFPPAFEKFCASLTPIQASETPPERQPAAQEPQAPPSDDTGSRPVPLLR